MNDITSDVSKIDTRGLRYGELLMASMEGIEIRAEIWSTFPIDACPQNLWDAIEPQKMAALHGSDFAIKNGPRVWLMDSISKIREPKTLSETSFGEPPIRKIAQLRLSADSVGSPTYKERYVDRKTVFSWNAGRTLHQLVNSAGERYTMQAYCLAADPSQTEESLGDLRDRLDLPEGWKFESQVIDEPFEILTIDREAVVIQDELQNTYSR